MIEASQPTNPKSSIVRALIDEGALEETIEAGEHQPGRTPGAAGHPEPGSGHDDSVTTTVDDGPAVRKSEGEAGAFGEEEDTDPLNAGADELDAPEAGADA
jgi:hypothetical protein